MKSQPTVSVIIPTYNRAQHLSRAIESVLQQTYSHIEIIVVDDGSTDHTASVVAQYPGITYIKKKNGGQASARNAGLYVAKGDYLATLDSDDCWLPCFLEESVALLRNKNVHFAFSNCLKFDESGMTRMELNDNVFFARFFTEKEYENQDWIILDNATTRMAFVVGCPAPSSALVVKRSAITNNWDPAMNVADDWDFQLSFILQNPDCQAAFCKKTLWKKFIVGNNVYESLNFYQQVEIVILKDGIRMFNKYKHLLTPEEQYFFKEMQIKLATKYAYRKLKSFTVLDAGSVLMRSFHISFRQTMNNLLNKESLHRKVKKMKVLLTTQNIF